MNMPLWLHSAENLLVKRDLFFLAIVVAVFAADDAR